MQRFEKPHAGRELQFDPPVLYLLITAEFISDLYTTTDPV